MSVFIYKFSSNTCIFALKQDVVLCSLIMHFVLNCPVVLMSGTEIPLYIYDFMLQCI